jgi:tetratricopeptide (TPR) repeat protein
MVQVRVTGPDGRALDNPVKVEVLDLDGIPISDTYSNRGGGIGELPRRFMDGTYRLRVSGPGIETATAVFDIPATEAIHRETVRVSFTKPASADNNAVGPPTVSKNSLNIPGKARDAFNHAMEAYARNDLPQARREFERAIALYPQYADAHNNFGVMLLKANDKANARAQFQAALADDPKLATAHLNLARLALSNNDSRAAETELDAAVAIDPQLLPAQDLLASTAYRNGELDKALEVARRVHAIPHHEAFADAHLVAGQVLLEKKLPNDAAAEYEAFIRENPHDPRVPQVNSLLTKLKSAPPAQH